MAGGVLIVSRANNLFPYYKEVFEALGFKNLYFTDQEKDSLNSVIREIRPDLMMIGCGFYRHSTPYMMGVLLDEFPKLNIAAVNIHEFPDDLAMYFIINGCNSYVNLMDGVDEYHKGMRQIRDGKKYVSPSVLERIDMRSEYPEPAGKITGRETEVIRLICSGYKDKDIVDNLHISKRTVDNHKKEIYRTLNVRNFFELSNAAHDTGIVSQDWQCSAPKNFEIRPLPNRKVKKNGLNKKKEKSELRRIV